MLVSLVGGTDVIDTPQRKFRVHLGDLPLPGMSHRLPPARRVRQAVSTASRIPSVAHIIIAMVSATTVFTVAYALRRDFATALVTVLILSGVSTVSFTIVRRIQHGRCADVARRTRALVDRRNRRLARLQKLAAENRWCDLSPIRFERFVLEYFRVSGFVARGTPIHADGGIDGVLVRAGKTALVQCKRCARPVGEPVVRDFLGVLTKHDHARGFLVAAASFTNPAREFAGGTNVTLIDGQALTHLLDETPYLDPLDASPITSLRFDDFPA